MRAPRLRPLGRTLNGVGKGLRDRRGATAVEFAIIASPFIFMIFAIIQLALYFMVQVTLDNAVAIAARQLRTGQSVADGTNDTSGEAAFKTSVCNNMSWLQSQCQSGVANTSGLQYLVLDVRTLGSGYSGASSAPPMTSNGAMNTSSFCYYSGGAGSAVEMRAFYRWQLVSPILAQGLQTFSGVAELQSTEVFQVEPNGQTNPSTATC